MEANFLGVPDVPLWLFIFLSITTIATTVLGMLTGTVGGLGLLAVMAIFFPPQFWSLCTLLFSWGLAPAGHL